MGLSRAQVLRCVTWIRRARLQRTSLFYKPLRFEQFGKARASTINEFSFTSEVLPLATRSGVVEQQFACNPHNTHMTVTALFGTVPANATFKFVIEQRLTSEWSVVGGAEILDLPAALFDKQGSPVTSLTWRFSEQIVIDPGPWDSERDVIILGQTYRQLGLRPVQRLTVESSANLPYAVDVTVEDVAPSVIV